DSLLLNISTMTCSPDLIAKPEPKKHNQIIKYFANASAKFKGVKKTNRVKMETLIVSTITPNRATHKICTAFPNTKSNLHKAKPKPLCLSNCIHLQNTKKHEYTMPIHIS